MQAGSAVVFSNLFHCVPEELLFSLLKQYTTLTDVVKDTIDLTKALSSPSVFISVHSQRLQNCTSYSRARGHLKTFSAQNHSLSEHD